MDALVQIINSSYDKVTFFGAFTMLFLCIFGKKELVLLWIKLPGMDPLGRIMSGVIGIFLLIVSIFVWTEKNEINLIDINLINGACNVSIVEKAYAQDINEVTIQQYRPEIFTLESGQKFGLYAGNVKPKNPSRLLVFNPNSINKNQLGQKIKEQKFRELVGSENIIFDKLVTKLKSYHLPYENGSYTIKIENITWNLIGSDYITIKINRQ